MSDGPFKNLDLDRFSKQFATAVVGGVDDQVTCSAKGANAILQGILNENSPLISDLVNYSQAGKLDINPRESIDSIFDAHSKSSFSDQLQKKMSLELHKGEPPPTVISNALMAVTKSYCEGEFATRISEEILKKHQSGEVKTKHMDLYLKQRGQALQGIDKKRIHKALWENNKSEFKNDIKKRKNLNDGPEL